MLPSPVTTYLLSPSISQQHWNNVTMLQLLRGSLHLSSVDNLDSLLSCNLLGPSCSWNWASSLSPHISVSWALPQATQTLTSVDFICIHGLICNPYVPVFPCFYPETNYLLHWSQFCPLCLTPSASSDLQTLSVNAVKQNHLPSLLSSA